MMRLGNLALFAAVPFSFRFGKDSGNPGWVPSSQPDRSGQPSSFLDNGDAAAQYGSGNGLQTPAGDYLALARDALGLIGLLDAESGSRPDPLSGSLGGSSGSLGGASSGLLADQSSGAPGDPASGSAADSAAAPWARRDATASPGIDAMAADDDPAPDLQEDLAAATVFSPAGGTGSTPSGSAGSAPSGSVGSPPAAGVPPDTGSTASSPIVDTGTGTGQSYHVHNDTGRDQYFLYSDASGHKAVMELKAGQAGTFIGGDNQPGIRIQTCGPDGQTRSPANEALFEAGTQTTANGVVNNPDVSDVDGNLSYDGHGTDIEITNDLGQKVGNLTGDAYRNWNDDTRTGPSNPMTMAQTPATQFDITFSDSSQTLATPGNR